MIENQKTLLILFSRDSETERKQPQKTSNVFGKHSELLEITYDPLAYAKEMVARYNEEAKNNNKVTMDVTIGPMSIPWTQKVEFFYAASIISSSTC